MQQSRRLPGLLGQALSLALPYVVSLLSTQAGGPACKAYCPKELSLPLRYRKYVVEDRYTAIRWAIATAQQRDIVVVAGKGDQDWTEVSDGVGGYLRVCCCIWCMIVIL